MVTYLRSHTAVMAEPMLDFFTNRVRAAQLQVFVLSTGEEWVGNKTTPCLI